MHIIGVSERREETGTDGIFAEIIVEGSLENSHGIKAQNTTHRQIIVKLQKTKDKENILRKFRNWKALSIQRDKDRITADFLFLKNKCKQEKSEMKSSICKLGNQESQ